MQGVNRMEQSKKYISEEWIGKKYWHLTITGYSGKHFDCICDCGNRKRVKPTFLFSGKVKTCGVDCQYHNESKDGKSKDPLYSHWNSMKQRCYNKEAHGYYLYGGRGITICDEWLNDFWAFRKWSLENGYKKGLSIDRINGNGNYEPSNCRWATPQQQRDNQSDPYTYIERPTQKRNYRTKTYNVFGEELTMAQITQKYEKSEPFIRYRLKIGMTIEEAVTTPKYFKGT